jgi:hypothetical protein
MQTPCKKCWLRYSSYCVACDNVKDGLGLTDEENIQAQKYLAELRARERSENNG